MSHYERIAQLPLVIEGYDLLPLDSTVASGFNRRTTVVRLQGAGEQGLGEDVTYEERDQLRFRAAGAHLEIGGSATIASFGKKLDELELFPAPTLQLQARDYRRWAFESAALDLALRQADRSLPELLGLEPAPLRFVVSLGLGDPPSSARVRRWLDADPTLRFKLDPNPGWSDALIAELRATGAIDVVDLKGHYRGTPVDTAADLELYRRIAEGLPDARLEDPSDDPAVAPLLARHAGRLAWDAPIHDVADLESRPLAPSAVNVKPSRFGTLRRLFAMYAHCAGREIPMYGGGQFELGPGRGQIQLLAALFHPDGPNDVAPVEYNRGEPRPGLPRSPLRIAGTTGFRA